MINKMAYRSVPTRWGPDYRFEVKPVSSLPFRVTQDSVLEEIKDQLLRVELDGAESPELWARLRRAANEAASLAWASNFPLLVFPVLFEEKAEQARRQFDRQQNIRQRSVRALPRAA
jgi:hypothetical protein